jgi:GlpG protein
MRQIGKLSTEADVRRFADYLLAQGITTQVEPDDNAWSIWVHDEDRIPQARSELAQFSQDPSAPRFREAAEAAAEVRREAARKEQAYRKNAIDMRSRWQERGGRRASVTLALIGISILVAFETRFKATPLAQQLMIASPVRPAAARPMQPLDEVRHGQIWRLVTPIFLHFGLMHIVFNLLWLQQLGSTIEATLGSLRFLLLVLVLAALSNLAQYAVSGPFFGGMSGVVYGLFGYAWMKSRYEPHSSIVLPPNAAFWMLGWLALCTFHIIPNVANTAHAVGLGVGMLWGAAPIVWKQLR